MMLRAQGGTHVENIELSSKFVIVTSPDNFTLLSHITPSFQEEKGKVLNWRLPRSSPEQN